MSFVATFTADSSIVISGYNAEEELHFGDTGTSGWYYS